MKKRAHSSARVQAFCFWHRSSLDTFFFSLDFFAPRFPHLVESFRAVWHLRHRFHSYNVGDNLLYPPVVLGGESFLSIRRVRTLRKVDVSRLGSSYACIECVHLRDAMSRSIFSQFSIYLLRRRREISQECARRRAFENRKASTTSRRFC